MAHGDIEPVKTSCFQQESFPLNAGESFRIGEPVGLNADGELSESPDDPEGDQIIGISLMNGDTTVTSDAPPAAVQTGLTYPSTTGTRIAATGDHITVALAVPGARFRTRRYSTDGANWSVPPGATVGDECGLSLIAGVWGVDLGAAQDIARITAVYNADGRRIAATDTTTGVWVEFTITISQMTATQDSAGVILEGGAPND